MREVKRNRFTEIISELLSVDSDPKNTTEEEGVLLLKGNDLTSNCFCNKYIKASLTQNNILDIEFFAESDRAAEIIIKNQKEETIYELKIFTAPTLHILVDTKFWDKGLYIINIITGSSYVFYAFIC